MVAQRVPALPDEVVGGKAAETGAFHWKRLKQQGFARRRFGGKRAA